MDGISCTRALYPRVDGSWLTTSDVSVTPRFALCTSTMGVAPVTVMVSSTEPRRISTSIVVTAEAVSSNPSRRTVVNPCNDIVSVYDPGGRLIRRYWPGPSVTAVRTFSISIGLDASTDTPGSTAPEASLTVPAMVACACAATGTTIDANRRRTSRVALSRISNLRDQRADDRV